MKKFAFIGLFFFYANLFAQSGLVAYFPFNGNANDESGNGIDGTVNGATLTTDRFENANSAYSFDGVDDDIKAAHNSLLNITEQISLAAWIFPTAQKTQIIIRKGAEVASPPYILSLSGTGDIVFSLSPNSVFTQARKTGYTLNEWTFVVGTYDGTTMKLYVNGQLEPSASESISGSLTTNSSPLLIGTRTNQRANTFDGKLDELRVYSNALSETEIQSLFNENTGEPTLIGAEIAGNVADSDDDGFGDNHNNLPGGAPVFMSAGVDLTGGAGSNGIVRMQIEWAGLFGSIVTSTAPVFSSTNNTRSQVSPPSVVRYTPRSCCAP